MDKAESKLGIVLGETRICTFIERAANWNLIIITLLWLVIIIVSVFNLRYSVVIILPSSFYFLSVFFFLPSLAVFKYLFLLFDFFFCDSSDLIRSLNLKNKYLNRNWLWINIIHILSAPSIFSTPFSAFPNALTK